MDLIKHCCGNVQSLAARQSDTRRGSEFQQDPYTAPTLFSGALPQFGRKPKLLCNRIAELVKGQGKLSRRCDTSLTCKSSGRSKRDLDDRWAAYLIPSQNHFGGRISRQGRQSGEAG